MPEDDSAVDGGVVDEASALSSGLSPELSIRGSDVAEERYRTTAEDNNCGGEPKTPPESELMSRSVIAGVCKLKTCSLKLSHTSDVPF